MSTSSKAGTKWSPKLIKATFKIARLSHMPAESSCLRENLDEPLDEGIVVSGASPRWRMSLMKDGLEVSWTAMLDFHQQMGNGSIRTCGIAGVGTHGDHRFKGYSRVVMWNSLRWMRQNSFQMAFLGGIPGFYPKFGYAQAFPNVTYTMRVKDAESMPAGRFRFVNFEAPRHLDAVLRIYHKSVAGRIGPRIRDPKTWPPFRADKSWGPRLVVRVAVTGRGQPAGYFAYDLADLSVYEVGYESPAVYGDLLREMTRIVWEARQEKITLRLADEEPFMEFCRPLGVIKETMFRRDQGWQVRLVNVEGALQRLAPLLLSRVGAKGNLAIQTNMGSVGLKWANRKMSADPCPAAAAASAKNCVKLPQWALAQLIYGHQSVGMMTNLGIVQGTKSGLAQLAEMFPPTPVYFSKVDIF